MKITIKNYLSDKEKAEIADLYAACKVCDGASLVLPVFGNEDLAPNLPRYFLGYEEDRLSSFLLGAFPDNSSVEVTAAVHPDYRKSGQFSELFQMAQIIYRSAKFSKLCFHTNGQNSLGLTVAEKFGQVALSKREYTMKLGEQASLCKDNPLRAVPITSANQDIMLGLARDCLSTAGRAIPDLLPQSGEFSAYASFEGEKPIGIFILGHEKDTEVLRRVAVRPLLQGEGYGKWMIDSAVREALRRRKPLILFVDSSNITGLQLFREAGFQEIDRTDYYYYTLV